MELRVGGVRHDGVRRSSGEASAMFGDEQVDLAGRMEAGHRPGGGASSHGHSAAKEGVE